MSTITPAPCTSCTVPTADGDLCAFCKSYEPPTEVDGLLAGAHCNARQATEDLRDAIEALPADAPLPAVVDVVAARAHLVAAQRLIDRAVTRITAAEVAR